MANLIELSALASVVGAKDTVIVDARSGPDAALNYQQGHLPGAIYVDVETDLSSKAADPADGGRHPLPSEDAFSTTLQRLGITPATTVIIYDHSQGANAAARLWWMLKAFGHQKTLLTNGDLNTAIDFGLPLEAGIVQPVPVASPYPPKRWRDHIVAMRHVQRIIQPAAINTNTDHLIIDVRENERYQGLCEPIDLVAGHIPGAINIPWRQNVDANGKFLQASELKELYSKVITGLAPEKVILQCGSGVSACHTLFALHLIGIEGAKLYVGSWSEWSRNGNPIACSEETR